MPEIRAEGLAAGYRGKFVWKDLDLVIDKPGLVCILGPNGVGKSTFMYVLNKILTPLAGKVEINGQDVSKISFVELAKQVAYVPQDSEETFSMSVLDTVLMGRYPVSGFTVTKNDLKVASECLDLMDIVDLAPRNFNELSGGQHQKAMIARGLAQGTGILLLDEPTSNLDIYYQMHVMKVLRDIASGRGMIVLAICHDLNVASRFADRLILFSGSGVAADGRPEDVMTQDNIRTVYGVEADILQVDGRPYAVFHAGDRVFDHIA